MKTKLIFSIYINRCIILSAIAWLESLLEKLARACSKNHFSMKNDTLIHRISLSDKRLFEVSDIWCPFWFVEIWYNLKYCFGCDWELLFSWECYTIFHLRPYPWKKRVIHVQWFRSYVFLEIVGCYFHNFIYYGKFNYSVLPSCIVLVSII